MASKTRLLGYVLSGAIVLAITACAEPHVTVCGNTGVICPEGTHCAAAQGICRPGSVWTGNLRRICNQPTIKSPLTGWEMTLRITLNM